MKVKKGKVGTGKENRVCKLKVETFSLLISILIHLGLLIASFSLSPPESTKYMRSIKVDYIISLPKINHHLRESSEKSIVSPLTLASGRENKELLKPSSILTKKRSISSNLRFQDRPLSPQETSDNGKRESLSLFFPLTKVPELTMKPSSLREGTLKMVSNIPGVNLPIDKATIFSSFSPLTRVGKSPLVRKIEGRVYLFREENLSQKRLADHTPSLATKPLGLNQTLPLRQRERTLAFVGLPFEEKKSELMPASYLPNLLLSKIKRPRIKAGLDLLGLEEKMPKQNKILYQRSDLISVAQHHPPRQRIKPMPLSSIFRCLSEESKIEIERINYIPSYYAESAKSRDSGAWISQRKHERKLKPTITSPPSAPIFPPERNLNSFLRRRSEKNYPHHQIRITEEGIRPEIIITRAPPVFPYKKAALREPSPLPRISLGKTKEKVSHEILSPSLDPIMQPKIRGYSPTIKEKKFSPLSTEPDFHREEIRILKGDTELLTELLRLREYAEKIRKLINANKKYPSVARQREWEGRIKVRFVISSSGRVIKTEVLSPSSYEVLNRAAEKLIKDSSPFPPLPFSWHKNSLTLEVQVVYQLKEPT
jgi:TonB family protein